MRTGTRVHSHRTGPPASELRYVAAVPATSDIARARSALARKLRDGLEQRGYLERRFDASEHGCRSSSFSCSPSAAVTRAERPPGEGRRRTVLLRGLRARTRPLLQI